MAKLSRRTFLRRMSAAASLPILGSSLPLLGIRLPRAVQAAASVDIYVAKNGPPAWNVEKTVALAGGIQRFVGQDDVVVIKPNGQWPNQGYTNTACLKAMIDVILNRPGGYSGEIIIMEHVHRDPTAAMSGSYCWNMSTGNRANNWPDMNYNELVADYANRGIPIVNADPLYDSGQGSYVTTASGPAGIGAGKQGWVHFSYTTSFNGRVADLSYPILRSSVDTGKLIDLKNGVWKNGSYTGQKVKLIFLPTLNNHAGRNYEDYAGPTSAVKTHIGIVDFQTVNGNTLHDIGYSISPYNPGIMGESVAEWYKLVRPAFYLTCAEYTGQWSRTGTGDATHTRTVGLCADPVTLDYWMCKNVLLPCDPTQTFMNPANNNHLRQALAGAQSRGVGTISEAQMAAYMADASLDKRVYLPIIKR